MSNLKSIWFDKIDRNCPLSEYPRPQLERKSWICLNGEWDFAFFKNVEELDIESEGFSSSVVCPDKMTVPFCWQMKLDGGYDVPNYINQDYPYPVDPPHLPDVIPCGFYRRKINFKKNEGKKYFINFEGVAPCFYLWVNGKFTGFLHKTYNLFFS